MIYREGHREYPIERERETEKGERERERETEKGETEKGEREEPSQMHCNGEKEEKKRDNATPQVLIQESIDRYIDCVNARERNGQAEGCGVGGSITPIHTSSPIKRSIHYRVTIMDAVEIVAMVLNKFQTFVSSGK
jgi:hypothetical protein